jgi:hypothetical protein
LACAGSGPGAGPIDGSASVGGSVGGGNYAAGPVSLPTPVTINKNLIVCENVAGPTVECRGSAGAVPPYSRVTVSVHPAGFASWREKLQSVFIGTAHAAGFSIIVNADGTGAFTATVEASKGEVIQIQVGASRLLLTVPDELGSVSGSTGTMKNMTVDSDGNIWFSGRPAPAKKVGFRWTSLFFSEAQAATVEPGGMATDSQRVLFNEPPSLANEPELSVGQGRIGEAVVMPERNPEGASCGVAADTATELSADAAVATRCEVKRLAAGSDAPEVVASFPGCVQGDIRFIRPVRKYDNAAVPHNYIMVGIRRSIYVVNVDQVPGQIVKRTVFPSEVLSADDLGDNVYVTLNGDSLPDSAPKIYLVSKVSWGNFASSCVNQSGLEDELRYYSGLQSVVSGDTWGIQFALAGRYAEGYRVLTGSSSLEFIYSTAPKEIFRSPFPLEVAILERNWEMTRNVFAVLAAAEKKLYLVEDYRGVEDGLYVDRIAVYTFDLSAYTAPYSLKVDRDNDQLAFLDRSANGTRLVVLPFQADSGAEVDLAAAIVQDLGNVTPSGLVRVQRSGMEGEWTVNSGGTTVQRFNNASLSATASR